MRLILLLATTVTAFSGEAPPLLPTAPPAPSSPFGPSLGGVLFPHAHFNASYGETSSERGHELGSGHHDPVADGFTFQGFEFGTSLRAGEYVEGFLNYHGFLKNESPNDYDGHIEEAFGKLKNLPGGLELRGGRYLNRFGLQNAFHLHGWDWIDNSLAHGRMLGDDGQFTTGGEIAWRLPFTWASTLSVSTGAPRVEEHGHEEEEGGEGEPRIEGEGALFAKNLTTIDFTNVYQYNDFHQIRAGLAFAWGDNAWGRTTQVLGLNAQYERRANGLETGGDYLRVRGEALLRHTRAMTGHLPGEAHHEEAAEGEAAAEEEEEEFRPASFRDWGLSTSVIYGHDLPRSGVLEFGLRYEYVTGVADARLPERHRISPRLTWFYNDARNAFIRAQYNHDRIDGGTESSVWLALGLNWGGPEVR